MIHHRLIKYHIFAVIHPDCIKINRTSDGCINYMGCGPQKHSCLYKSNSIPCAWCKIWTGYSMKDWEIENMITMLEVILSHGRR